MQPLTKRLYHKIFYHIKPWIMYIVSLKLIVFCSKPSYHHKHGCLVWNIKLVSLQVRIYTLLQNTIEKAASKWCYSSYQHKHSIHRCRIQ
jgi:hypothetical protein